MSDDREPVECCKCHQSMSLDDGCEWGDSERLYCWGCAHDEIDRLREYRDHHEFVLSQIEAATRVKISTIDDVLAEIKGLNAVVAKLTRDCNSLEDDVRYNGEALARANEMKGEIERLRAIVDRLPKTVDGLPITPWMPVWLICGGELTSVRISWIAADLSRIGTNSGWSVKPGECYSTREAAEKARKP